MQKRFLSFFRKLARDKLKLTSGYREVVCSRQNFWECRAEAFLFKVLLNSSNEVKVILRGVHSNERSDTSRTRS